MQKESENKILLNLAKLLLEEKPIYSDEYMRIRESILRERNVKCSKQ